MKPFYYESEAVLAFLDSMLVHAVHQGLCCSFGKSIILTVCKLFLLPYVVGDASRLFKTDTHVTADDNMLFKVLFRFQKMPQDEDDGQICKVNCVYSVLGGMYCTMPNYSYQITHQMIHQ